MGKHEDLRDIIARCRAACGAMARRHFVGYPGRPSGEMQTESGVVAPQKPR